jgi:hypothetical protein
VALDEHFGDGRRAAEVAVDLEWRVQAEQVRRSASDEHGEKFCGAVAASPRRSRDLRASSNNSGVLVLISSLG